MNPGPGVQLTGMLVFIVNKKEKKWKVNEYLIYFQFTLNSFEHHHQQREIGQSLAAVLGR